MRARVLSVVRACLRACVNLCVCVCVSARLCAGADVGACECEQMRAVVRACPCSSIPNIAAAANHNLRIVS